MPTKKASAPEKFVGFGSCCILLLSLTTTLTSGLSLFLVLSGREAVDASSSLSLASLLRVILAPGGHFHARIDWEALFYSLSHCPELTPLLRIITRAPTP